MTTGAGALKKVLDGLFLDDDPLTYTLATHEVSKASYLAFASGVEKPTATGLKSTWTGDATPDTYRADKSQRLS